MPLFLKILAAMIAAAFLMNVAPNATPIELRIVGLEVVEGGTQVRVACRAGGVMGKISHKGHKDPAQVKKW